MDRVHRELIENSVKCGELLNEAALPLRLGFCSILTSKAAYINNPYLRELISKILKNDRLKANKFNEIMKRNEPYEAESLNSEA
jgi:predicted N-acyltransferase